MKFLRKLIRKSIDLLDPLDFKWGLVRVIIVALVSMTTLRAIINPTLVVYPADEVGIGDYITMIGSSTLAIAIDATLVVILSWRYLRNWKDAVGVAVMVGLTHAFFPLGTFLLTFAAIKGAEISGLPPWLGWGVETGIYLVALRLLYCLFRDVHSAARSVDTTNRLKPKVSVWSRDGVKQVGRAVFLVSIDALAVGPAKVIFIARYSLWQVMLSFVLIGGLVFLVVLASGFGVLLLKRFKWLSSQVHHIDFFGNVLLIELFMYFSVMLMAYVLYAFGEVEWWLAFPTFVIVTAALSLLYWWKFGFKDIKAASRQRGLV